MPLKYVDDVDKFSDAELRTKLLEFGFPVMPITGTTRKVMAKKLKMLLENKSKIGSEGGRRSLGRYSSEDESDNDVKITKKKENRRITMAASLMQPPASNIKIKKSTRFNDSSELELPDIPIKREIHTTTTTRTQKIVKNSQDEFDTGSDSEPDLNYHFKGLTSDGINSSSPSSVNSANKYSPPKSVETSYSTTRNISLNTNASPSRLTSYNSPSLASEYATDKLNQIRSRLSLNSPSYEKSSYSSVNNREETPFLSNFTKRLSSLSSQKNDYDYKNDIIKEHDVNGSSASVRSQLNNYRSTRGRESTYDYRANRNNILKNNFVSFAVLAGAALFFVLLAILYMGMRSDTSVIPSDFIIPHCVFDDPKSKKSVNCIHEDDASTAIHLLNVIMPELYKKSVAHKCFDPKIKPHMTEYEIISFCLTNYAIKDHDQIKNDLRNLLILTFKNPQWGINIAQTDDNNGAVRENDLAKNMEQVIFNEDKKTTSLVILNPQLPWKCVFYSSFSLILNSVLFMILLFGILYLFNLGYKYYKHHIQNQKDEIGFMVERIIDILQSNASEDGENFVVINHVRDMILPVGERQKKTSTWAKAVKFINEHESRVRTEVEEVKGEPFEVWRWIGNPNVSSNRSNSSFGYRQGRRIVDPEYLINETLKFPHRFLRFCKNSDIFIKNEVREGFVSVFVLECRRCKVHHAVCSEEPESGLLSANLAFIAGIVSLGLNLFELNELCSSLHIPLISANSYNTYLEEIFDIYNESATKNDDTSPKLEDDKNIGFEETNLISSTPKSKCTEQMDTSFYETKKNEFLEGLRKSPKEIEEISKLTINQKNNPLWFQERRKRLTASNFGRICKLLDTTNRNNTVKSLLHSTFTGTVCTRYGNVNEINALKAFENLLGLTVTSCGLFISKDYPFLAASPDGLIENKGLVEIKCPYKTKEMSPEDGIKQKLIQFATFENGIFKLKREDKYYYQVQGQLFVTDREYCYFVVWSPLGLLYEKIFKDQQFWNKMLPKLKSFYFDHILPAILEESSKNKSWQGQAFETQVGSVNSLPCSPTPCLKIRGMVEDGDRNTNIIREAVLSKCAHQCRILHCGVDTCAFAVYLKCADTSDAAIAYRNLHGWWYAGHLVTVKYLRLERYMQRFPDSPLKGPPYLSAITPATDWSS